MQKLETILAEQIRQKIKESYSFEMGTETATGIARSLINTYKAHVELPKEASKRSNLRKALDAYFATTKIPIDQRTKHSCWFFKEFLEAHYYVLVIPRNRLTRYLNKIFHFWFDPL